MNFSDFIDHIKTSPAQTVVIMGNGQLGSHYAGKAIHGNVNIVWYARDSKRTEGLLHDMLHSKPYPSDKSAVANIDTMAIPTKIEELIGKKSEKEAAVVMQSGAFSDDAPVYTAVLGKEHRELLHEVTPHSDVVYYTLGLSETKSGTRGRNELLLENTKILAEHAPYLASADDALMIMTPNPDGAIANIAQKMTGLEPERIVTAGPQLDSIRFQSEISKAMGIHVDAIRNAHVIGNHGSDMVVLVDDVAITNSRGKEVPLQEVVEGFVQRTGTTLPHDEVTREFLEDVVKHVKGRARDIVDVTHRGTEFAPARAAVNITREFMIARDNKRLGQDEKVYPIVVGAAYPKGYCGIDNGAVLGHLVKMGSDGVEEFIDMGLSSEVVKRLQKSAEHEQDLVNKKEIKGIVEAVRIQIDAQRGAIPTQVEDPEVSHKVPEKERA